MTISVNFSGIADLYLNRFTNLQRERLRVPPANVQTGQEPKLSVSTTADSMRQFASALSGLGDSEAFLATAAASSDRDVVRVTAHGRARVAEHSLEITQLATMQVTTATTGYADTADVVADGGSVSFSVNGSTTTSISISSSTTLSELKDLINSQNSGVVASIANDGVNNRLIISSRQSGRGQGFTINNSLTHSSGTVLGFETGQSSVYGNTRNAGNARFSLNGNDFNGSSNTFEDVIEGLTLTLVGEGSTTVTASSDYVQLSRDADRFVREFNTLDAAAENMVDREASSRDRVILDATLPHIQRLTRDAVNRRVDGRFNSLSDVGFTLQQSGRLQLDKNKLNVALNQDAARVERLFSGNPDGEGVFADLSARLGIRNAAGGTLGSAPGANRFLNVGADTFTGLGFGADNLSYVRNMIQSALDGIDNAPARVNVRA